MSLVRKQTVLSSQMSIMKYSSNTTKTFIIILTATSSSCWQFYPSMMDFQFTDMPKYLFTDGNSSYLTFFPVLNTSMQFDVRATDNAHIALTKGPIADETTDPMIEIFLESLNNTKSSIRKNRNEIAEFEIATPNITNGSRFSGFWVSWDKGLIKVGHAGNDTPLMSWQDPDPFQVGYISMRSSNATGSWKIQSVGEPVGKQDIAQHEYVNGRCQMEGLRLDDVAHLSDKQVSGNIIIRGWLDLEKLPSCVILRGREVDPQADLYRTTTFNFQLCTMQVTFCHSQQRYVYFYYEWYIPFDLVGIDWVLYFYGIPGTEWR